MLRSRGVGAIHSGNIVQMSALIARCDLSSRQSLAGTDELLAVGALTCSRGKAHLWRDLEALDHLVADVEALHHLVNNDGHLAPDGGLARSRGVGSQQVRVMASRGCRPEVTPNLNSGGFANRTSGPSDAWHGSAPPSHGALSPARPTTSEAPPLGRRPGSRRGCKRVLSLLACTCWPRSAKCGWRSALAPPP